MAYGFSILESHVPGVSGDSPTRLFGTFSKSVKKGLSLLCLPPRVHLPHA
ncbi:unnamed protein product [Brassica rapa]|uniref:Uncharacterized protein n=1 Tax=Brassica campestris TaxID=3711 RepID=A0A8D9FYS0_BRACM|nr:unnamed protein product [Brassica rapa]